MENKDSVVIPFKNREIALLFEPMSGGVDIDEVTRIDYNNLYAELVTIPTLINRSGQIKAEMESVVARAALDLALLEATVGDAFREASAKETTDSRGNPKMKYATGPEVVSAVDKDQSVFTQRSKLISSKKQLGYVEALYWAVKSKSDKLDRISAKMDLSPEEFERNIIEGTWNTLLIKNLKQKQ